MSIKSERVTILTTPDFKKFLNAEADAQGVSVSELIRVRCTSIPASDEDEAILAAMVEQVNKSTEVADKALTKGLKDINSALKHIRKGK
jgi:hypothetical protein